MDAVNRYYLSQEDILRSMKEGFLFLDDNFIIREPFSDALCNILKSTNPSGKSFLKFLDPYLEKEHVHTLAGYLDIINDRKVDEELIKRLNPLIRMDFKIPDENGLIFTKYLTFEFNRIVEREEIVAILVTIRDESEAYLLNNRVKTIEENSKKQLDWLTSIIQIDRNIMREFIASAYTEIEAIQLCLKCDDHNEFKSVLEQVSRRLHLVKGNANLLDFSFFARRLHALEEITITLMKKEGLDTSDFLSLIFGVQNLKENLDELEKLIQKLTSMDYHNNVVREQTMLESIRKMVSRLSFELKKEAVFDDGDFKAELIPPHYLFVVKNTLVQMAKNSMAHGLETAKERKENNKKETGLIRVSNMVKGNTFIMTYYDDGRGLQLEKLKERALQSGNWREEAVNSWDNNDLAKVIFDAGISSSDDTSLIHGRGFGMNLIKNQIDKFNGTIEVKSAEFEYCAFTITLPLTHAERN